MADEYLNVLDLVKRKGSDQVIGLIEENLVFAPELVTLPVRTKRGTSYKITKRTDFPAVQFRDVNEGVPTTKSTYKQELVNMFFLDGQMEVDEAIVKGDDMELGDLLAQEASGITKGSLIHIGSQVYYGQSADAKGFFGFGTQVNADQVVSAAGAGNSTTSAWFVWENLQGVHLVVGNEGEFAMADDWFKQRVTRDSKHLMAWVNNLSGYIGMNIGSKYSLGRIKNITSAKPLTDGLAAELLSKFPVGFRPTRVFMNRNAAFWLQRERSANTVDRNDSKGSNFAPYPTEIQGIPIQVTDSLTQTEVAS